MKLALVSLLLAWGLFGLGVAVLSPGPSSPVALSSYESLWRAQDGLPGTLPTLEGLASRSDGLGWQARVLAGRAHVAAGDPHGGADFLGKALSLRPTTDLRRELASALEAAGEPAEALAQWKRLLPRSEAIAAIRRLEPDPLRLAGLLAGAGRYTEAWSLVRSNSKPEARLTRARILVGLGLAKEALPEFESTLRSAPTDVAVRKEYARALERAGEREQALAAYRTLGATGAYEAGRLLETLGRPKEAAAAYLLSKDTEARWRGARLLESDGQTDAALAIYLELARGTHRVHDDAALRAYLLAEKKGRTAEAREMASLFPPAFQWLLGTYRAPAPPPSRANLQNGSPMAIPVAEALLDSLPAADRTAWAEAELDLALPTASATEKVAIAKWFAAHGDYHSTYEIGTPLLRDEPARETYVLSYPLAFWDSVNRWATTYGVDSFLVLAVIREESNYLPTAVSSSDARGLMQLLPSTAQWIAESKVKEPFSEDRLTDPDFNIRLGTWYLGYLIRLFDSDIARAVAAYNGGQGNVERWSTAAKVKTAAEFPGALVASETREYLVKVLDAWLVYRVLYGGGASPSE
jgi:soluble lytic murein transglycosylase